MTEVFQAENISKSAKIHLNATVHEVFPLFGPFEERKWADGWNPTLLFPENEEVIEGATFTTEGNRLEGQYTWRINQYHPEHHHIQYFVFTPNRHWTIDIRCEATDSYSSSATIEFSFTGLNPDGNQMNEQALEEMYEVDLKDWEKAINYYLSTGLTLLV